MYDSVFVCLCDGVSDVCKLDGDQTVSVTECLFVCVIVSVIRSSCECFCREFAI